jgi:hypothetical protein
VRGVEGSGFRFIDLNCRPFLRGLGGFSADPAIAVCPAVATDEAEISTIAGQIFQTGRLL